MSLRVVKETMEGNNKRKREDPEEMGDLVSISVRKVSGESDDEEEIEGSNELENFLFYVDLVSNQGLEAELYNTIVIYTQDYEEYVPSE